MPELLCPYYGAGFCSRWAFIVVEGGSVRVGTIVAGGKMFFFGCGFDYSGVLIFVSTCAIMVLFFFLRNLSFFRRFVVI